MATGKTHSRHSRLYLDGIDLSGDSRQFGQVGVVYGEEDMTTWTDGVVNFQVKHGQAKLEGYQAVLNNTAAVGSLTELSDQEEYILSLLLGIRAAPAAGDPAFSLSLQQISMVMEGSGPLLLNVDFPGPGQDVAIPSKAWGKLLYAKTTIAITTTSASIDFGAAQASGAHAYLQIFLAETVGTWALKVQDSPNGSAWSDYITFTANGTVVRGEQGRDTTSMDRYVRFVATYSGGGSTNLTVAAVVIPQ